MADELIARFREVMVSMAEQIVIYNGMVQHPKNSQLAKDSARRSADEMFLDYTRFIAHAVENLDKRLKALEAKNHP